MHFPMTSRRLAKAQTALGYTPEFAGEDDGYVVRFYSRIGAPPSPDSHFEDVDNIAKILAGFTPKQTRALGQLCAAFGLSFADLNGFINFICHAKDTTWEFLAINGVHMNKNNEPIDGAGWKYEG